MIVVDVTIPDGCTEGVEFPVDWGGTQYVLTVPAGSGPGELLQVELPANRLVGVTSEYDDESEGEKVGHHGAMLSS